MHNDWLDFLHQQGARIEDDTVTAFADGSGVDSTLESDTLCDLSHLGLLKVSGSDSTDFLQGQTSNDLRAIDAEHSQLSSYNSPKGRMLSIFRLFQRDDDYYLQMPREVLEATRKRLNLFVLRSQVTLSDASDDLVRIGVAGATCETLLNTHGITAPPALDGVTTNDMQITVIRIAGHQPRFELVGSINAMQEMWYRLIPDCTPVGADTWGLFDIRAGLPAIYTSTVEAFVPQMTNLQLINGVNFKKGCYPGQEVVARMHYLGKLKRRMYLAHSASQQRPQPGDKIFSSDSNSSQGAGKIVDARPSPGGGYDLLAVMEIAVAQADNAHYPSREGPKLRIIDLPYPFETA